MQNGHRCAYSKNNALYSGLLHAYTSLLPQLIHFIISMTFILIVLSIECFNSMFRTQCIKRMYKNVFPNRVSLANLDHLDLLAQLEQLEFLDQMADLEQVRQVCSDVACTYQNNVVVVVVLENPKFFIRKTHLYTVLILTLLDVVLTCI